MPHSSDPDGLVSTCLFLKSGTALHGARWPVRGSGRAERCPVGRVPTARRLCVATALGLRAGCEPEDRPTSGAGHRGGLEQGDHGASARLTLRPPLTLSSWPGAAAITGPWRPPGCPLGRRAWGEAPSVSGEPRCRSCSPGRRGPGSPRGSSVSQGVCLKGAWASRLCLRSGVHVAYIYIPGFTSGSSLPSVPRVLRRDAACVRTPCGVVGGGGRTPGFLACIRERA